MKKMFFSAVFFKKTPQRTDNRFSENQNKQLYKMPHFEKFRRKRRKPQPKKELRKMRILYPDGIPPRGAHMTRDFQRARFTR